MGISKNDLSTSAQVAIKAHTNYLKLAIGFGLASALLFYVYVSFVHHITSVPIRGSISLARPALYWTAVIIFVLFWYYFDRVDNRMISPKRLGLLYNSFVLSLATTIVGVAVLAVFVVGASEAFKGLTFDVVTSSVLVGAVIGATAYVTANYAETMTVQRVFAMLALIMFGGIYITAVAVATPDWYNVYLSALGMESAGSVAKLFNFSLVFAGIMLIAMGSTLMQSVQAFLVDHPRVGKLRYQIFYGLFVAAGLFLAGIGLFPFVENTTQGSIHVLSAGLLGATFVIWMWGVRGLVPYFDMSFYITSYVAGAAIALIYWLATIHVYFNVTGEELSVFVIATVWLSLVMTNTLSAAIGAHSASTRRSS